MQAYSCKSVIKCPKDQAETLVASFRGQCHECHVAGSLITLARQAQGTVPDRCLIATSSIKFHRRPYGKIKHYIDFLYKNTTAPSIIPITAPAGAKVGAAPVEDPEAALAVELPVRLAVELPDAALDELAEAKSLEILAAVAEADANAEESADDTDAVAVEEWEAVADEPYLITVSDLPFQF